MAKSHEGAEKKAAISPLTITILVIALGAVVYLLIPSKAPEEVPKQVATPKANSGKNLSITTPVNEDKQINSKKNNTESDLSKIGLPMVVSGRNPFLPPNATINSSKKSA